MPITRAEEKSAITGTPDVPSYISTCGIAFTKIYENDLVEQIERVLNGPPLYIISRALNSTKGKYAPASYSKDSVAPIDGPPGNGKLRAHALLNVMAELGDDFNPYAIISSSGPISLINGDEPHFGLVMIQELTRNRVFIGRPNCNEIPLRVQEESTDTIGEVFAIPKLITGISAENRGQYPSDDKRFTVFSSTDQVDRLRALEALMFFQNLDTGKGQEVAQQKQRSFKQTFMHGPAREYLQRYRGEITAMARTGEIPDTAQVLKALYLLDDSHVNNLTYPAAFRTASDILYNHPRYTKTFMKCCPNLQTDLTHMANEGIEIHHLTAEEVIVALDKKGSNRGRYVRMYLPQIYGKSPREQTHPVFLTFINELAGILDLLRGEYYAQGERADTKIQFTQELSRYYDISLSYN